MDREKKKERKRERERERKARKKEIKSERRGNKTPHFHEIISVIQHTKKIQHKDKYPQALSLVRELLTGGGDCCMSVHVCLSLSLLYLTQNPSLVGPEAEHTVA